MGKMDPSPQDKWPAKHDTDKGVRIDDGKAARQTQTDDRSEGLNPQEKGPAQPNGEDGD